MMNVSNIRQMLFFSPENVNDTVFPAEGQVESRLKKLFTFFN